MPRLGSGDSFMRYRIEALLGEGGMGQVYRAYDKVLRRRVALKIVRPERPGSSDEHPDAAARTFREARAAAALSHRNAVAIFDVGEYEGTPFIAMELVEGRPLRGLIGDSGVMLGEKIRWLADVAWVLESAHRAGLIHRDIKPENVMVCPDGSIKVLDFGIAKRTWTYEAVESPPSSRSVPGPASFRTAEGNLRGTPRYMAPEQLAGEPLDGRCDQYAWGLVAFELVYGHHAACTQPTEDVGVTFLQPPPSLAALVPGVAPEIAAVVMRTLARSPAERFGSMEEVAQALEPFAVPAPRGSQPSVQPAPSGIDSHTLVDVRPQARAGRASAWRRVPTALFGVAGFLFAALLALWASRLPTAARPAPLQVASARPGALLTVLDLPKPSSTSQPALAAYVAGIQAQHDASQFLAREKLEEAATLDPTMAAAHLRYGIAAILSDPVAARTHFQTAVQLRQTLGKYDQALLDAVEPIVDRIPADWAEADRRLVDASRLLPEDAELVYFLSRIRLEEGKLPEAILAADSAIALDPRFAAAHLVRAEAASLGADSSGALSALKDCLDAVPQAGTCLYWRLMIDAQDGRCTDYESDSRQLIALFPESDEGYSHLAEVSFALGRPKAAVREAWHASWTRRRTDDRIWQEARDRYNLATLEGDAPAQVAAIKAMNAWASDRTEHVYHALTAWSEVDMLDEMGAFDRAADVAEGFLRRRDAWTVEAGPDIFSVGQDRTPVMLRALTHAGRISESELGARRGAWIETWRRSLSPLVGRYLWIHGYAEIAETESEARDALRALSEYATLPEFRPAMLADADVGRVMFLGGRVDEGLTILRHAVGNCDPFESPGSWVRAHFWLGRALEAKGSTREACDAYASVIARWDALGRRSTTARAARARIDALGCATRRRGD